jgi:streptomycin 6-kinase
VIDPKGAIGDRCYEVATALHNPTGHEALYTDPTEMRRRVATFAQRLNLDPQRILRWCFAQSTLSAAWHLRDESPDAETMAAVRTARAAKQLLTSV